MSADERREQVIAAAIHEFGDRGYHAASTAAIARRAGISQPYIFALFPSKQQLFIAVLDTVFSRIWDAFTDAAVPSATPEETLSAMGSVYPALLADRHALLAQLQTYATGDPVITAHAAQRYRALHVQVTRLSGAGEQEVSMFFAIGMLANVTAALGLEDISAPLFNANPSL